jgi:hypothetical protein
MMSYTMSYIHIVYDVVYEYYNVVYKVVHDVVSFPDTIGFLLKLKRWEGASADRVCLTHTFTGSRL